MADLHPTRKRVPLCYHPMALRWCHSRSLFWSGFSASIYTTYLEERDFLFLDPASMLLYTLCVGAFIAGLLLIDTFFPLLGSLRPPESRPGFPSQYSY